MTTYAGLSVNRKWVLCGSCGDPLCQRSNQPLDKAADGSPIFGHILIWATEWRNDDQMIFRLDKARARVPTLGGHVIKGWRTFALGRPARCPACGAMNTLDGTRLGVVPLPSLDP